MSSILATAYGPWALVTGSSSGIGEEFANQLAAAGINVVLAARRADKLEGIARRLRLDHGVEVKTVPVDLTGEKFLDILRVVTDPLDIGLVVSNAGGAASGALVSRDIDDVDWLLRLNVRAPTLIANHYGQALAKRGKGGLLFVSSSVAYQSTPLMAEYGATKAHQLYLGEALNGELKRHGVDVTVLSAGPTRTPMIETMDEMDFSKVPVSWMESPAVVRAGLEALGKHRSVVPGRINGFFAWFGRHFPRLAGAMFSNMMSKGMDARIVSGIGPPASAARLSG